MHTNRIRNPLQVVIRLVAGASKKDQLHWVFQFSGFRKILKKHDKNMNTDSGAKWRAEYIDTAQVISKPMTKTIEL